ncbi:DUF1493 family protein [Gibbsiella greigii]
MELNETGQAVFDWYSENWNSPVIFSRKKPVLTLDTSLSTGKYPWVRESGHEIMTDYFQRFNVDPTDFDFLKYWPHEKGLLPNFLRPKTQRIENIEPEPLTIRMLIESAIAGRWLY